LNSLGATDREIVDLGMQASIKKNYLTHLIDHYKVKSIHFWRKYGYSHHITGIMNAFKDAKDREKL